MEVLFAAKVFALLSVLGTSSCDSAFNLVSYCLNNKDGSKNIVRKANQFRTKRMDNFMHHHQFVIEARPEFKDCVEWNKVSKNRGYLSAGVLVTNFRARTTTSGGGICANVTDDQKRTAERLLVRLEDLDCDHESLVHGSAPSSCQGHIMVLATPSVDIDLNQMYPVLAFFRCQMNESSRVDVVFQIELTESSDAKLYAIVCVVAMALICVVCMVIAHRTSSDHYINNVY